jgi:uncharacterized RDD family membrane protein YckC
MKMLKLWKRRFVALLIDALVITLGLWLISALIFPLIALANIFLILNLWIVLAALVIIGYFTYLEGNYGTTIGKNIMKLKVEAIEGNMDNKKAFIRNISKMDWIPLIVDLLVGYYRGDSKERYLDDVAKTRVVTAGNEKHVLRS